MERHTFALEIKKNCKTIFRHTLGELWPEITDLLDQNHVRNFSLWNCEAYVFGYYETEKEMLLTIRDIERKNLLTRKISDTVTWISPPEEEMRLMYHNYGTIRESKELIRHRVFMAKLKSGCEEEYKRRHDVLVEARHGITDPGPDSNFTIWSAGGYIFGYDEIDTTMEKEETPESREATTAWETKQLEIMDWISNDVDWITGDHHSAVVRIGWHDGKG